MRRRLLILTMLLALLAQTFVLFAYARDGADTYDDGKLDPWDDQDYQEYYDDFPYEFGDEDDGIALYEEETITFDSFTTRELQELEILKKGVDVSEHQEDIDWEKVKADGVDFAFIRVGYHGLAVNTLNQDAYYKKNIEEALAQGLRVGVYFYSQAITVEEAIEEADFVLERIRDYELSLPVVFDYEYGSYNGIPGRLLAAKLTKDQATAICQAFCDRVEEQGFDSMVYANRNFLYNQLHREKLGNVWMAHYALETDYQGEYAFWQCTSSGRVDGIRGYADLNFWFDDGSFQKVMSFRDVGRAYWGYEGIRYAYDNGIVNGVKKDTFNPEEEAIRGDVAMMLYRVVKCPEVKQESPFTDLIHEYYREAVAWAYESGVIKGRTETTFDPTESVTRQELVSMLYRLAGAPESKGDLKKYADEAEVFPYAKEAMSWAVENEIIQGFQENGKDLLKPTGTATRAQIATIIMRYVKMQQTDTSESEADASDSVFAGRLEETN